MEAKTGKPLSGGGNDGTHVKSNQKVLQSDSPVNGVVLLGEESPVITKGGLGSRPVLRKFESGLRRLYILGLPALGSFDHIELDLLTFLQAAESAGLDGREVYEYVLSTLAADETITLGVVKPLYCSCFHGVALFLFLLDVR